MTTRATSIEAYNTIKENGLLSKARFDVYEVLFEHGPMTANDLIRELQKKGEGVATIARNTHARLSELRTMECAVEVGTTQCSSTGMNVILWDVTARLPVKQKKDKLEELLVKAAKQELALEKTKKEIRKLIA